MGRQFRGLADRLLAETGLDESKVLEIFQHSRRTGISPPSYMISRQLLEPGVLARTFAREFQLPQFNLDKVETLSLEFPQIDAHMWLKLGVVPLLRRKDRLVLGIADPSDRNALDQVRFLTGLKLDVVVVEYDKLRQGLSNTLTPGQSSLPGMTPVYRCLDVSEPRENLPAESTMPALGDDDLGVSDHVDRIIRDAMNQRASDIHLEPYEEKCRIRFRIDGILHEIASPPISLASRLVARVKVLARMNLAEKRLPQDGRIQLSAELTRRCDLRVSSLPTLWGEKIVMRLLAREGCRLNLENLGMDETQLNQFRKVLRQPQGLILVTGPTGSGKTMTLYAALDLLNTPQRNISTAENPVEVTVEGINQVQVNQKLGLSFSETLRALLRQDPDVIMVGEMRDQETAEIAVKAAQTGHLVLSTLHTSSAAESLTRLRSLGIPGFNLSSCLRLVIAQRLLRRLCNACKELTDTPEKLFVEEGVAKILPSPRTVFRAVGCGKCKQGYLGRTGIYEVMTVNAAISRIIAASDSIHELQDCLFRDGVLSLRQTALLKVALGLTSLDEANRVT